MQLKALVEKKSACKPEDFSPVFKERKKNEVKGGGEGRRYNHELGILCNLEINLQSKLPADVADY